MTVPIMPRLTATCVCITLSLSALPAMGQVAPPWDLSVYNDYFEKHAEMTAAELLTEFDAGAFRATAPTNFSDAAFSADIERIFELTPDEIELTQRHGFVVSERMTYGSFGHALYDIFTNDMPVYVSSDAILHALHMSYDDILIEIERHVLISELDAVLAGLHAGLPELIDRYASNPAMATPLSDVDLYLTVAGRLMGRIPQAHYEENSDKTTELLGLVQAESVARVPLFAETGRDIDFSQFRPRGHYAGDDELERYFQTMMWLGRIELYLIGPKGTLPAPTPADVRRQNVMTALLSELIDGEIEASFDRMDTILRALVGESDNVTLSNFRDVFAEAGFSDASQLLDSVSAEHFQDVLAEKPFAFQRILSQILLTAGATIQHSASFLPLGQRFVIDSYVSGSLVFDKIVYQGKKVKRMMPSTLDIMFALGNDAAGQFLQDELTRYHYAPYLASVRTLIDSYEDSFWSSSMYNGWLNGVRQLSPPANRESLPAFMQTAAWWQKSLNTQLASWAQLRHDNLLYAKPSYTGGVVCLFPESYVEPIPEFFEAIQAFATHAGDQLNLVLPTESPIQTHLRDNSVGYFRNFAGVADTLATIAQKQLDGEPVSPQEREFLGDMLLVMEEYAFQYVDGWYPSLFYQASNQFHVGGGEFAGSGPIFENDLVVADVHTQPTDEVGAPVGKVLHVGTGPANMAVIVATPPGGQPTAFVGPVLSYYEHTTLNFERLTDEEWATMYDVAPSARPEFADLYLADHQGKTRPGGLSLATSIERDPDAGEIPDRAILASNYPNPFSDFTTIRFTVPAGAGARPVSLQVFDSAGRRVAVLVDELLAPGSYSARFETSSQIDNLPSGSYGYVLDVADERVTGVMTKVR